ncbi:alpha/beta fold hydrolase [Streptomyces sp. NPDC006514]|uniref:thioesterase II family protein n=1 Tax=unclassified Streptomyces TaxID=2593676 RepID=UPI0033A1E453
MALICLPFAGGGAGFYRAWKELPEGSPDVLPLQLPGREELFIEEPFRDAVVAGQRLAEQVAELSRGYDRIALFGHSLGAVLAYETARNLDGSSDGRLAHLFVSGSPGPWTGRAERATELDDEEFVAKVEHFAGFRHEALSDPDMREILLPLLRADVEMHENYKPVSQRKLGIPVTSLRGTEDALVSRDQAAEWGKATDAGFDLVEIPGRHMYLVDDPQPLLAAVVRALG